MKIRTATRRASMALTMLKYSRIDRRHTKSDSVVIGCIVRAANRIERHAMKRAMIDEGLNDLAFETV